MHCIKKTYLMVLMALVTFGYTGSAVLACEEHGKSAKKDGQYECIHGQCDGDKDGDKGKKSKTDAPKVKEAKCDGEACGDHKDYQTL